jgi:mRNA-degrading endonuclease RelE of RelBE toxin-antitoxin system
LQGADRASVESSKAVLKALLDLPPKQFRQVFSAVFDLFEEPPLHYSKTRRGTLYSRISVGEDRVI